ncbi:MAG: BPL-N domain-containing protein [Acidobacteriota bacterium]
MRRILLITIITGFFFINHFPDSVNGKNISKTKRNIPVKVGVYGDQGASAVCVTETMAALKLDPEIDADVIFGSDIADGVLNSLDVIVFPGGSGSKEAMSMGVLSRKKVRDFVMNEGKGCVAICAGGYLVSSTPVYKWSLKLTSSSVFDRAHYNRGRGLIELSLTEKGENIFPELKGNKSFFLQYNDGPVLVRSENSDLPDYEELGKYVTDIHLSGNSESGITPGKTALLLNKAGKGKVFVIAGHPESTPGMQWIVPRMVRVVANRKIVTYPKTVVRPERYSGAILFDSKKIKREKSLFWKLTGNSAEEKIDALTELVEMRSRPALRWAIGLLRDDNPEVRMFAVQVLAEADYTPAINDIEIAVKYEKNGNCLKEMKISLNHLNEIINR